MRKSSYYLYLFTLLLLAIPLSHVQAADQKKATGPLDCTEPLEVDNIAKGTQDALACEWMKPDAVRHVLKALKLMTENSPVPLNVNLAVLDELKQGDPSHEDLYRAAMGVLDPKGQPTAQGLPDFLDTLAKANTLNKDKKKPLDKHELFDASQAVIDNIFNEMSTGKQALVGINDSFSRKDNHVALFQLLVACLGGNLDKDTADVSDAKAKELETLRAAFEMDTDALAKQVAAKIAPAKE